MEFWGVEVKSGQPQKVEPGLGMILHLSQASIGEVKKDKGSESACLFVNIDGKKLVLGTLFPDKLPQQQFDLVFDKDFELSHNWKSGSVYFYGYKAPNPDDQGVDEDSDSGSEEEEMADMPVFANNRKSETKAEQQKPVGVEKVNASKEAASGKQKVKIVEPNKEAKPEEDDEDGDEDDTDDDDDTDEDGSTDEDMEEVEDESDSEEDDESDKETPKKVEIVKKRATESATTKTPVPDKKAKVATPQKTDGKKGSGHVATPHPSKPNKSNQQTPKSSGSHACSSCKKSFGSESALQSHTKAKHGGGN